MHFPDRPASEAARRVSLRLRRVLGSIGFAVATLGGCPPLETPDLAPRPGIDGTHLLRLVHISDPQIVDEESPARSLRTERLIGESWRPQEAYGIHTLDATLQRINAIHAEGQATGRPVDFTLVTGDLADLAQHNELQWCLDTMDGKTVTADSGLLDGALRNVPAALNPKLPYAATGLNPDIPWYTCFGNHDGLAVGNFPIDRSPSHAEDWFAPLFPAVAEVIGYHDLDRAWNFMLPTADLSPAVVPGSGAPLLPDLPSLDIAALEAGPIEPDPARRFLSAGEFIAMHLASTTPPRGHGFTEASLARKETWYSVRPRPDVPLRLIVFDTVASGAHFGLPLYYGALLREHLEAFIIPELDAADRAGEWVILASHHPSADFAIPFPADTVSTREFRRVLAGYPGVLLHLVGHTHRNRASIVPGPHPYLEIETGSIIDYPQEGRILDLILEDDGETIRVESRMFSHAEAPTVYSTESHRLAEIDFGVRAARARAKAESDPDGEALHPQHRDEQNPRGNGQDRDFAVRLPR